MATKLSPIFNLTWIQAQIDSQEWERVDDYEEKRVYLGSIFNLTPSGKFYTPFANSNVDRCERCKGSGKVCGHKSSRVAKRNQKRYKTMATLENGRAWFLYHKHHRNTAQNRFQKVCPLCFGVGSREAYLDGVWQEQAEEELNSIGLGLCGGEGDGCDLFAVTTRDIEDDED